MRVNTSRLTLAVLLASVSPAIFCDEPEAYQAGFTYTGDILQNTRGGVERATRYVDLLSLYGDIDTEKAWGHKGGTVHVDYLISHNTFNEVVGDAQVSSNIDFDDGERLYELWYEQQLGEAGSSIKTGLYDVNSEFDSIDTAGLFLNSSHGAGVDWSQSGVSGPSFSPLTGLGVRGLWAIDPAWKLKATVVDGVPGDHNGHNHKTHVQLRQDEGAMSAAEVNFQPQETLRLGLGSWYYTRQLDTFDGQRDHSNGAYAFADVGLGEAGGGNWASFVRAGRANDDTNPFGAYYGAGITFTGKLFKEDDQVGLAIASARNGNAYLASEELAGNHWDKTETAIELTYASKLTPWLSLQPDIQYIVNPGTDPSLDNALVIGLRVQITAGLADLRHAMNRQ